MRRAIRYILVTGASHSQRGDHYSLPIFIPRPTTRRRWPTFQLLFCTIGPDSTSVAILERAGARVVYPILPATRLLQVVALVFWVEAKSATTTNSGAALLRVSKQTSNGQAITTTAVTQPRASL